MLVAPRGEWIRHYSNAKHLQTDGRTCPPRRSTPLRAVHRVLEDVNVNVNVNKQYLSSRKSCNKGYDGCAMRVVFSKPQNCPGFNDGSAFQHMGPEITN